VKKAHGMSANLRAHLPTKLGDRRVEAVWPYDKCAMRHTTIDIGCNGGEWARQAYQPIKFLKKRERETDDRRKYSAVEIYERMRS
jgi:hypothetical protein